MKLDEKVNLARKMCQDKNKDYPKFNYLYSFSNENINAYDSIFDFKDKSYLTLGSSGDQAFNAILSGCTDITVLDICPFTPEYFYLKVAAMELMNRKHLLNFLGYRTYNSMILRNMCALDDITFVRVLSNLKSLNYDAHYFWEKQFKENKGIKIRKRLFNTDEKPAKTLVNINPYLMSDENYNKLRQLVKESRVTFINQDIFKFDSTNMYDNINLSNIGGVYGFSEFMNLFDRLKNNLSMDGTMLVAYLYDTDYTYEGGMEIYNPQVIKKFPDNTKIIDIPGISGYSINDKSSKDSIIVYKKVKKG